MEALKMDDPNHHPSKMDVLPSTFFQIILAAKTTSFAFKCVPQRATTFAFSSVPSFLLWLAPIEEGFI